jgi:lipopolysaccharide transport system ATP-binding protein
LPAITVEHLSKEYVIGGRMVQADTLRERVASIFGPSALRRYTGKPRQESFWALKDVSFDVAPGEVVGIIGRNGAGKSTLLKILSRITEPTTGRAELFGRVSSLLEVGTGFHPELSGRENVFLNGSILGMSRAEITKKFDEIVAFAEVERFLDTPVKHYSSGMYMRLAFAVSAHLESEIMIVDEVLAVGDVQFQKKCLGKMRDVSMEGRTVLFVSHNMTAVRSQCSRAIWIDCGKIIDHGDVGQVVSRYMENLVEVRTARTWEDPARSPGNDFVRILKIRVFPEGDGDPAVITVETPVGMEFEIQNNLPDTVLNLSLFLYNAEEIMVFNVCSDPKALPAGKIRCVCHVPGNFLNDSIYRLRLMIVQDTVYPLLDVDNLAEFIVHDTRRVGSWYGKWPGVVRPAMAWTVDPE